MIRAGRTIATLAIFLSATFSFAGNPHKKPPSNTCSAWSDNFNAGALDSSRWIIATGQAPGAVTNQAIGYYETNNIDLSSGMLAINLTQVSGLVGSNASGVISYGGLIYTKQQCGYGTYSWTMKMSSTAICPQCTGTPISGSVSAGFLYVNNSQTEIDFEYSALNPSTLWLVNWLNPNPNNDPTGSNETATPVNPFDSTSGFHTYTFVWSPGKISYYIDGTWQVDHTTNVPSAAAYFMINHWGTNSTGWGGLGTPGVQRTMYVSQASFSPAQ